MRTPVVERPHRTGVGVQRLYRFANGYGASVVRFDIGGGVGSYGVFEGLWELAVLRFDGPSIDDRDIAYDTPVTDDVVGYLDDDGVDDLLREIEALPPEA